MTVHLVTFSDDSMSRSRRLCVESAKRNGVDRPYELLPDADSICLERGWGFWKWKPNIIYGLMTSSDPFLKRPEDGDIVIYADAGVEFIENVTHIIDRMDQDIFLFGNMYQHAHWCKGDIVQEVWPDTYGATPWEYFGKQVQASVIFFRVNDKTRAFVKEWLDWCLFEGGRLIDDSPSRTPNHPEFQENRHDQAILTTMAYRDGIRLHAWPAVYNRFLGQEFVYPRTDYPSTDNYPSLFHHHRLRNYQFDELVVAV